LATACWGFIVAKTILPEPAPVLVFRPLQVSNSKSYTQLIYSLIDTTAHHGKRQISAACMSIKWVILALILDCNATNQAFT
jgi:hypothetical protein